jgi:hypothetical protein
MLILISAISTLHAKTCKICIHRSHESVFNRSWLRIADGAIGRSQGQIQGGAEDPSPL